MSALPLSSRVVGAAISCVLLAAAGCVSPPDRPSGTGDPDVGGHVDELYQLWGSPGNRMTLPNSDRLLYEWRHGTCVTNVTTDASGVIRGVAQTGDCQRD
jgi:hypothetical protein